MPSTSAPVPSVLLRNGRALPYRIKRNARSRRVRLIFCPREGLTVTAPARMAAGRVAKAVQDCREWIESQLLRAAAAPKPQGAALPEAIDLPAIGESWRIERLPTVAASVSVRDAGDLLILRGRVDDDSACRAALARWLTRKAREAFSQLLYELGRKHGFPEGACTAVRVGRQRTRWGSRSPRGVISLNLAILFLTPEQARYVLVHELCHGFEMNHSPRFWERVAACQPDWRDVRRSMRGARIEGPGWLQSTED